MIRRGSDLSGVLLALVAPVLMFPDVIASAFPWFVIAVALVAGVVCVRLLTGVDVTLTWCVVLLSLAAGVGLVRSPQVLDSLNHFCGLALGLLAMATVAHWCRDPRRLATGSLLVLLFGMFVLGVGFRSVTAYGKGVFAARQATTRVPALPLASLHARPDVNPNALAATALMLLPIAVAVGVTPPRMRVLGVALRVMGLVVGVVAAVIVFWMESRTTMLGFVVICWIASRHWLPAWVWWALGATGAVVVPLLMVTVWSQVPQVVHALGTLRGRTDVWVAAWTGLSQAPWFGIGFDYFRHSGLALWPYPPNLWVGAPHAHNMLLQTALDVGLVGLVAYLAVIGVVIGRAVSVARSAIGESWVRRVAIGAALSIVSVHVFGIFDAIPLGTKVGLFQWLAAGLIIAAWRLRGFTGLSSGAPQSAH